MAATPKTGVVTFKGLQSGCTYEKAIYNADTVGGNVLCRIDNGGGTPGAATGADFCVFDEPVAFVGGSFITGIVETTQLRLMLDYNPTPYCINWANSVNTLAFRPQYNIGIKAGRRISFMQVL
jgi:hypothetical protein